MNVYGNINLLGWFAGNSGSEVGVTYTTIEKDLGATKRSGKFTITGTGFTVGKQVLIYQATGPYTGKGTLADECQMDSIIAQGVVTSATNIDVYWNCGTFVKGNFKFNYLISS